VVVHVCNPRYSGVRGKRIKCSSPAWVKLGRCYLKKKKRKNLIKKFKGLRGIIQVVEYKAQSSIPITKEREGRKGLERRAGRTNKKCLH
jgi:hypothetical protein